MRLERPLAYGRTAEVYPWKAGWVLKLYYGWFPPEDVKFEARIARSVHAAGLMVPAVGEIVEIAGRVGLEYERVDGISLWEEMAARPWVVARSARPLAELHAQIHAVSALSGLPSQRDRLERNIAAARGIDGALRRAALKALEAMPGGDRLCHGDFHPRNVILTRKKPVVIDWINATVGDPLADLARTTILALGAKATAKARAWREKAMLAWAHRAYVARYFELQPGGQETYRAWQPIVAAARTSEGIEELEGWLRRQAEALRGRDR